MKIHIHIHSSKVRDSSEFQQAKTKADFLWNQAKQFGEALQKFPKGPMGLTPEDVAKSPEYRMALALYNRANEASRNFNTVYTKQFKKELAAERANRYK
jgi:hypothetical protein